MYEFNRDIKGDALRVAYISPTYMNYGVAFTINEQRSNVKCFIVTGEINGVARLEAVTDHSCPLEVLAWASQVFMLIQNTVNEDSIDIENLFTNHGGRVIYQTGTTPSE